MEYLVELDGPVIGVGVQNQVIDCLCGKKLFKVEKATGKILYEREVFQKEGLARNLLEDHGQIIISDFCTLNIYNQDTYELMESWQIGEDLSSDICGMQLDENTIYCSIRNGRIITIDRKTYKQKDIMVSESSMWSLIRYEEYLICGTVDGKILFLDAKTMSVKHTLILGKQNVRSLYIDGTMLYAACQDKKLVKVDLNALEIVEVKKKIHNKMFDCAGIYDNQLVTVSYPCSEIALWNKDTLEKSGERIEPLRLSGCAWIEDAALYLTSRNINGLGVIDLKSMGSL